MQVGFDAPLRQPGENAGADAKRHGSRANWPDPLPLTNRVRGGGLLQGLLTACHARAGSLNWKRGWPLVAGAFIGLLLLIVIVPVGGDLATERDLSGARVDTPHAAAAWWVSIFDASYLLIVGAALSGSGLILLRARRAKEEQSHVRADLRSKLDHASESVEELRAKLKDANRALVEVTERLMRRVGADLHDGPAQSLSLALLRIGEIKPLAEGRAAGSPAAVETLDIIERALADALREIRQLSAGLSLPELQQLTPAEVITVAVRAHERNTSTKVAVSVENLPDSVALPYLICLFRVVQEALNNAFRHAEGKGQAVTADYDGSGLTVRIDDHGRGFPAQQLPLSQSGGLGLAGLRHRVQALGGDFQVRSAPGEGTTVAVRFSGPFA